MLGSAKNTMSSTKRKIMLLLMAGVVFALANIFLKDAILGTENVPPERRTTVFDKE